MPTLTFILPHWMYWGALIIFPLVAIYLVSREKRKGPAREPALFTAYMFWLCSGFLGLHRLYLKSWLGLVYVPLFLAIAYCNGHIRDAREDVSRTHAAFEQAKHDFERAKKDVEHPAAVATTQTEVTATEAANKEATAEHQRWFGIARNTAIIITLLLLLDAFLIPGIVRRLRASREAAAAAAPLIPEVHEAGTGEDPTLAIHTPFTDVIDSISTKIGEYVGYWAVLAVFAYFYEVVARYLFSSPTNWVHESMFLMFGMQYMLSGAYAYATDQHVRVDVFYAKFSARGKAIADIVTSVFFFIFTLTMLWTGFRFAWDSVQIGEHSFTEWYVQYWPIKLAIPIGAALIVLQGVSKLIKDIVIVTRKEI